MAMAGKPDDPTGPQRPPAERRQRGGGWLARIAPRLEELATPAARLYVEAEAPLRQLGRWSVIKAGQAGQVYFHLLEST